MYFIKLWPCEYVFLVYIQLSELTLVLVPIETILKHTNS